LKKGLKNNLDLTGTIYHAFLDHKIEIPIDLLAIDYNRYLEINNDIGYIYKTIKNEGKVIYDKL
jgi:hypothetical protein